MADQTDLGTLRPQASGRANIWSASPCGMLALELMSEVAEPEVLLSRLPRKLDYTGRKLESLKIRQDYSGVLGL